MKRGLLILCLLALLPAYVLLRPGDNDSKYGNDWRSYQGDDHRSQYSTLSQIDRSNVGRLEVAWVYRSGDADTVQNRSQIQANPLVIEGVLYGTTPGLNLIALDAATGREIWRFNPFKVGEGPTHLGVNRGVMYWEDGDDRRILYTAGPRLFAIDAGTGRPVPTFGEDGSVSLHAGLGAGAERRFVSSNTPGAVYKDLVIMGTRVSELADAAPGHIRAFNIRTGELAWIFHTIPRPGEPGYETWPPDAWKSVGGANSWAGMSLDPERGIVFIPTGSASFDFYGGNRLGENLFANTILALNAETGERIWHYQVVHHDLWDRDLPAPPNLMTVTHDGRRIDAVAQITKQGNVFLLDRDTGEPLFPIIEQPVQNFSNLEGEEPWLTQPFPLKPPPFARQYFGVNEATDLSIESRDSVVARLLHLRSQGPFTPPSMEGTIIYPGFDGGGEWGGAAHDPNTGILYVNSNEMPWILTMVEVNPDDEVTVHGAGQQLYVMSCASCHGADRRGDTQGIYPSLVDVEVRMTREEVHEIIETGRGVMPSFAHITEAEKESLVAFLFGDERGDERPAEEVEGGHQTPRLPYAHTGYHRFYDPEGYPAVKPPWGTLNAIDMNEGEILWSVPLGERPELTARGIPPTGTENYGGPVVTASGLIFIAATNDEMIRAFDRDTGEVLWEAQLPAGGYATPATYEVDGKQYVVVAAGGGKMGTPSGDAWVAFSLPD